VTGSEGDPFAGCHVKLARARHHRDDLNARTETFLKPDGELPHGVAFDRTRERGIMTVKASFIAEAEAPAQLGAVAADLVNNLRTALDYLVAALKRAHGATANQVRQGGFPVARTAADFAERAPRALAGLAADSAAWRAIEQAQPFHADDPAAQALAVLVDLNNTDKHRLLQPTYAYPTVADGLGLIEVRDPKRVMSAVALWRSGQPLGHGTPLAVLKFAPGAKDEPVAANQGPVLAVSWGGVTADRTTFEAMITAVEDLVAHGPALVDDHASPCGG
jgi:hypothetical protein